MYRWTIQIFITPKRKHQFAPNNKHLMTGSPGNNNINFVSHQGETLRFELGKQKWIKKSLVICYMYVAGNFGAENSLILVVTIVIGQHWRVTVHYYPLTS